MKINNTFTAQFIKPAVSSSVKSLAALYLTACVINSASAALSGINLPPTQGTSDSGAFLPGIYAYGYTTTDVKNTTYSFNSARFPINVETANDPASLQKLKSYIDQIPNKAAIICMFDTLTGSQTGHGDGLPNSLTAMGAAWKKINAVFSAYSNVHYEIFNEPFGYSYSNPTAYVNDMKKIISNGGLPSSKCILDGMGYAANVNLVAAGGWSGDLAYHFYPTWSADHSQSAYSNQAQSDLGSWGQKTWLTEFGANLGWSSAYGYANSCYDVYVDANQSCSADVNCLRGLDDALRVLKANGHGIKGSFYWHGWNNGDTYCYWNSWSVTGVCKVQTIQQND